MGQGAVVSKLAAVAVVLVSGSVPVVGPAAVAGPARRVPQTAAARPTIDVTSLSGERTVVSGWGEPGSLVTVTGAGGALLCRTVVPDGGQWSCSGLVDRGPLHAVATDRAGVSSAPTVVADADLRVEVAPPQLTDGDFVVRLVVTNLGSASAQRVRVALGLPGGLVATGTAVGARCSGSQRVTCVLDSRLAAPPVEVVGSAGRAARTGAPPRGGPGAGGGPARSPWRAPANERTTTATVTVPVRLTAPCPTWSGGLLTATVASPVPDLNRANNEDSVQLRASAAAGGCTGSPRSVSSPIWMNVYVGLIVAALATLIAFSFRFRPPGRAR